MTKLSKSDVTLLQALQNDAQLSNEKLGELVHRSSSMASRRVGELVKSKVITGFHARINPEAVGLTTTIYTLVSLKAQGDGMTHDFEAEINAMPHVVEWVSIQGSWDYLLKFVVRDRAHHDQLHFQLLSMRMVSRLRGMSVIGTPHTKPLPIDPTSNGE